MARFFKKLENVFFGRKTHELDTTQMWFLTCSEEALRADKSLNADLLRIFLDLRANGFAIN